MFCLCWIRCTFFFINSNQRIVSCPSDLGKKSQQWKYQIYKIRKILFSSQKKKNLESCCKYEMTFSVMLCGDAAERWRPGRVCGGVLIAGECKYSLSFILPADKLQLHSPSKNISNPVTHQSNSSFWPSRPDSLWYLYMLWGDMVWKVSIYVPTDLQCSSGFRIMNTRKLFSTECRWFI